MKEKTEHEQPGEIELSKALSDRYSCRAYLDIPVPRTVLQLIFELAQRAPTSGNTQPAKVYVLQGRLKDQFVTSLSPNQQQGPSWYGRDLPVNADMGQSGTLKARRIEIAKGLEAATLPTGIDKQQLQIVRNDRFKANYNFFGAPIGLIITLPKVAGTNGLIDVGIYIDYLCHAAQAHGLATCIQGAWWNIRDQVTHRLNIDPKKEDIVVGISLGYPDKKAAINQYRSPRAEISDVVNLVEQVNVDPPSTFVSIEQHIETLQALNQSDHWGIAQRTWDRALHISSKLSEHVGNSELKKVSPPNAAHDWGTLKMTRWVLTPYFVDANTTFRALNACLDRRANVLNTPTLMYVDGSAVADGLYWELIDLEPTDKPNAPSVHRWRQEAFPHAGILSAALAHHVWRDSLGTTRPSVWLPGIKAQHPETNNLSDTPFLTTVNNVSQIRYEYEGYCTPKIVLPHLLARVRCE